MTASARELVEALLAARNTGSREQVHALLTPDATYWDCLGGQVRGAEAVAEALIRSRLIAETLAAGDRHAVAELTTHDAGPGDPVTEVYELREGLVAECRAYFDPAARTGRVTVQTQAASKTMSCAPSHSTVRPSSRSCSRPSVTVRKWLPASWPMMLANIVPP